VPNYKEKQYFCESDSSGFDTVLNPGDAAPFPGIYRCESCGYEWASRKGYPLPLTKTCSKHELTWRCGDSPVSWRLVAAAIHRKMSSADGPR
jgi:hypothetical protein